MTPPLSPAPAPFRLKPAGAARYMRLRLRMLASDPWAFGSGPDGAGEVDLTSLNHILAGEQTGAIFAIEGPFPTTFDEAQAQPELIAAAGITRAGQPGFAHRARVWGVFVEPAQRGRGLGRAVMAAVVELAKTWPGVDYIDLSVSENSPAALLLYESLGFVQWGREPEATDIEGRRYDEIYMTLRL